MCVERIGGAQQMDDEDIADRGRYCTAMDSMQRIRLE